MSQINFMPWAKLGGPTTLGSVRLVPWMQLRAGIPADVRAFLDRYFARYVTNDGQPMQDIPIAYVGNDPLAELTPEQRSVIQRAIDVLTFSAVTSQLLRIIRSGNSSFGVPNSERFQLVTQRFKDFEPYIAVKSGGVMHAWGINDIHFCMPWCVGSDFYHVDDEVLVSIAQYVQEPTPAAHRIARAFEWFRLAHTGNDDTSELSRVIMMATAFEILLEPADPYQKRKSMTRALHNIVAQKGVKVTRVRIGNEDHDLCAPAVWLDGFYRLRNKIVHGDQVVIDDLRYPGTNLPGLSQRIVAAVVMWEVVMWHLFDAGLVAKGSYKLAKMYANFAAEDEPDSEFVRYVAAGNLGIKNVHAALRWRDEEEESK
jgi:Apea-like HEPN